MRKILYILFAVGAVLVVLALTMVFVNDDAYALSRKASLLNWQYPVTKQAVAPNNALPAVKLEAGS